MWFCHAIERREESRKKQKKKHNGFCYKKNELTNNSTSGGTINSGRSCDNDWQALAASSKYALLNTDMKTVSLRQFTKSVISCSVNRNDVGGLKYQTGSGLRSLNKHKSTWSCVQDEMKFTDANDQRMLEIISKETSQDSVENLHYLMDDKMIL